MICDKTLKEYLEDYEYGILQSILQAKWINVKRIHSHEDLCEQIASHMLKKEELERYLSCLFDDEIEQLIQEITYDLEHGTREGSYSIPMLICQGEYACRFLDDSDDCDKFWLPMDVAKTCLDILSEEFTVNRMRKTRFLSCLMAIGTFYGKIPLSVIAPIMKVDVNEIPKLLEEIPREINSYTLIGDMLYHRDIFLEYGTFREFQETVPYYIPDERELEELGRLGYLKSRAEMRALVGYLMSELNTEEESAEYAAMWIQKMVAANECLEDVYEYMRDFEILRGDVPESLAELMEAFRWNTRMLKNRGFSKLELLKPEPAEILKINEPIIRYIV